MWLIQIQLGPLKQEMFLFQMKVKASDTGKEDTLYNTNNTILYITDTKDTKYNFYDQR